MSNPYADGPLEGWAAALMEADAAMDETTEQARVPSTSEGEGT